MKYFLPVRLHTAVLFALGLLLLSIPYNAVAQDNIPPTLSGGTDQIFCKGTPLNIAPGFDIFDPDDSTAPAIYIQISSGYLSGQDMLTLNFTSGLTSQWDTAAGKLTITGSNPGQAVPILTLVNAVQSVTYNNTAANPAAGIRTFSITLGDASYLPSTGHYYKFIPANGILWTNARTAAENSTYYGLQGYLATLLTAEEAQLCGEQATGNGWIGGSDTQTEGVWRWVTGPEAGTIFWNGGVNGSTPNFAFWNNGEPNNMGDEDYAHITSPGVGIPGSWNDLQNGGSGGDYSPKGYVVEYGGMPGDPVLPNMSVSSTINVVRIQNSVSASRCGNGTVTLTATASENATVYWYTNATGGTPIATGTSFTTPALTATTTYYVSANDSGCATATRTAVTATINEIPMLTVPVTSLEVCHGTEAVLTATASAGTVNWYDALTGGTLLGSGTTFTSPPINADSTFYAEATNNGCISANRIAINITVLNLPAVQDEEVVFCENSSETISAGISGMDYTWSTGATTETIAINNPGTYTVTITNSGGCSAIKTVTATTLTAADIIRVDVSNDTAYIIMSDPNLPYYEFAVDGGPFGSSNTFGNLSPGNHTAYARSVNGCGSDFMQFAVYMIPKYFTPNGDTVNDRFTLTGMSAFPNATVTIFDRYGKLITTLSSRNRYWDGTLDGNDLPASDYWYIIKLDDKSEEIKGHFSLIR